MPKYKDPEESDSFGDTESWSQPSEDYLNAPYGTQKVKKPTEPETVAAAPSMPAEDPYLKQFQESQAGVLGSAAGQLAAAQLGAKYAKGGAAALEEQQRGAMGQLRARSGQAFAAQQARGGGGSLAGMRQSQLSRGIAEGQLMGNFGMQKIAQQRLAAQAQKEAAQAAGEYATTQQKLKQQEGERAKAQIDELSAVQKTIQDEFDTAVENAPWYWGDKDRERFAEALGEKYKNHPNPQVRDLVKKIQADVLADEGDFEA